MTEKDSTTSLPHYLWWGDVPAGLLTRTALKAEGLQPGGPAMATIRYGRRGHYQVTDLYDRAQAQPRRVATPTQLAALEKARATTAERERQRQQGVRDRRTQQEAEREAQLDAQVAEARAQLRALARRTSWVTLDTETTDLDGEVIEVAVCAPDGTLLFESLVRPVREVSEDARAVHGITDAELATAPAWPDVWAQLAPLLSGRDVIAWNAGFDEAAVRTSARRSGLVPPKLDWICAMVLAAPLWGEWSEYWQSWRYPSLDVACLCAGVRETAGRHRAPGDARRLAAVMRSLAGDDEAPALLTSVG